MRYLVVVLWTLLMWLLSVTAVVVATKIEEDINNKVEDDESSCPSSPFLPQHLLEFYINGEWVSPKNNKNNNNNNNARPNKLLDVINPSYNQSIGQIALGDQDDTDAAVVAARKALWGWSHEKTLQQRRSYVTKLLDIYLERREEMAQLISQEMGAPIDMAREDQVGSGAYHIETFLQALEFWDDTQLVPGAQYQEESTTTIHYEPIGVVGLITPWNWPMNQVTLKVIPALLVGCTCVLKPSEIAPLSSLLFAEMIHEAGFPPGVFNLINGDGLGVGTQLSSHMDIDMISFTGSTRAGRLILQNAAQSNLKKVSLELGGKGANLIFEDAIVEEGDLEEIVKAGVYDCFGNSGQSCNAPTRMLVERSIYDRVVQIATEVANNEQEMIVQPANLEGDFYGPVASEIQFDRVQRYIQLGIDEGAKLVAGGLGRPPKPAAAAASETTASTSTATNNRRGFFVKPTVFVDVTPEMTIAQEEIFGPVLSIMVFDTEEEAIQIANGTPYGLTHYVHTGNIDRRRRLAKSLQSGMIEMNGIGPDHGAPFAAMKASGNGREGGIWGLEDFTVIKVVSGVEQVE